MRMYDEIQARKAEIEAEIAAEDITAERLAALKTEAEDLAAEERTIIENAEARKAEEARALEMAERAEEIKLPTTEKENKTMTDVEIRSSRDYAAAWLKGIKSNDFSEARSLLTTQASGSVPVPTFLENEIKTAWEENKILALCKKSNYKGNVKIGFEYEAGFPDIHEEGAAAPEEESLTIGAVEIANKMIKKWITVSDEAIEGTTVDTMGYLLKEVAYKIVTFAEAQVIAAIAEAPEDATSTAVGVPVVAAAPAVDTIVKAVSKLSGQARNLNLVMNRGTYADLVSAALNANYGVDVFDGLKDKIVFNDFVPSYAECSPEETYIYVGDFGYGAQVNLPNGEGVNIKIDDASLAEKDLVKVVGRMYAGFGIVADRAFAKVTKPAG